MIIKLFLFWRTGLFLVTFLGSRIFPQIANQSPGSVSQTQALNYWLSWAQWDGGNYLAIANNGYQTIQYFAFAPLFPLLAKTSSLLFFGNTLLSGLIIANLSFLAFLHLLYKYVYQNYSKSIAKLTLVSFLTFPTTFFTVAYYSESSFLLFTIVFFIYLAKSDWLKSSLMIILASITRFIGIFLAVSLIYSYFSRLRSGKIKISPVFITLPLSFLGILAFMLYLKFQNTSYTQFLTSQSFWQRLPSDPISTIFTYVWSLLTLSPRPIIDYFDLMVTVTFIGILVFGVRKIPPSLWIFSTLAILSPASTGTLSGIPRYVLASLGTFIIIAQILEKYPNLKVPVWTASLFLQAILAALFINGFWVA